MNSPRCAWCGGRLDVMAKRTSFCGQACRHAYEEWCVTRASARAQAVSRWRDMRNAKSGDMVNELLSFAPQSSANRHFSTIGGERSEQRR